MGTSWVLSGEDQCFFCYYYYYFSLEAATCTNPQCELHAVFTWTLHLMFKIMLNSVEIMEISHDLCKSKFALLSNMVKNNISVGFLSRALLPLSSDGLYWEFCPIPPVAVYCGFSEMVFLCGSEYCVSKVP